MVPHWLTVGEKVEIKMVDIWEQDGLKRPEAISQARAAQMLAELLGVVCHKTHYAQGYQKVNISAHYLPLCSEKMDTDMCLGFRSPL